MDLPSAEWDDDDANAPPKPRGLELNLWLDVAPMRPSAYRTEPAMAFMQATRDQIVYHQAMADVAQEAAGFNRLANGPVRRVD